MAFMLPNRPDSRCTYILKQKLYFPTQMHDGSVPSFLKDVGIVCETEATADTFTGMRRCTIKLNKHTLIFVSNDCILHAPRNIFVCSSNDFWDHVIDDE